MIDTIRYFLRHALVTTVFFLRLIALPLVHLVQTLAGSNDSRYLRAFSFYPTKFRSVGIGRPNINKSPSQSLSHILELVMLPVRMTRDLYRLATILQQNPEILAEALPRDRASAAVALYKKRRFLPGASTHSLVGPPAPTEMYHAALSERGDLDGVLAAFDLDGSSIESLATVNYDQTPEQIASYEHLRSLQCTPPEMRRPLPSGNPSAVSIKRLHQYGFACFDSVSRAGIDNMSQPSTDTFARTLKSGDCYARMDEQRHMTLPEGFMGHDIKELLGETDNLARCSTYVRRHRRSSLPMRLGTQSAVNLGSTGRHDSQSTLPIRMNPPPRKGAKLMKRKPPAKVASKTSMMSLLKRS